MPGTFGLPACPATAVQKCGQALRCAGANGAMQCYVATMFSQLWACFHTDSPRTCDVALLPGSRVYVHTNMVPVASFIVAAPFCMWRCLAGLILVGCGYSLAGAALTYVWLLVQCGVGCRHSSARGQLYAVLCCMPQNLRFPPVAAMRFWCASLLAVVASLCLAALALLLVQCGMGGGGRGSNTALCHNDDV